MGSLTVHVLNEYQEPIVGKEVYCNFPGSFLAVLPTNSECYTDENGIAEFDDVPVGLVEIYVDGTVQLEIGVGVNDHKDVTVTV